MRANDQTETGLRLEGPYENDRNAEFSPCFKAVIREAFNVTDVICAHHLVYVSTEKHADGFEYQIVQEIPAADTLIFDHGVAQKIWGADWRTILMRLAMEPVETRDQLFSAMFAARPNLAAFLPLSPASLTKERLEAFNELQAQAAEG